MLAITETAAVAITTLMSDSQMPEGAGLRIAQPEGSEMLELSVALAPAEQDTVLEAAGASVFLEPIAAQALDDKVLDVERVVEQDEDQYRFAIAPQAPA
jgi:Fe-S cluster assembly iron-binding protein IscA